MAISPANQKEITTVNNPQALLVKTDESRFSESSCFVYICEGANISEKNSSLKQVVNMLERRRNEKCLGTFSSFPHIKNVVPTMHLQCFYSVLRLQLQFLTEIYFLYVGYKISYNFYLKGSYDAFLKIIILCIWCKRIC